MAEEQGIHIRSTGDSSEAQESLAHLNDKLEQLEARLKKSKASTAKSQTSTNQFSASVRGLGKTSGQTTGILKNLNYSMLGAASAASTSGARLSAMGRGLRAVRNQSQMVSYQVQDIAVQMAMGTSAMTAFSQNVPQLLSVFGAKMAMLGAFVALVPLAVMGYKMLTGGAQEFSKALSEGEKAVDAYIQAVSKINSGFSDAFAELEKKLNQTSETMQDLAQISQYEAVKSIRDMAASLADANTEAGFWRKLMIGTDVGVVGELLNIETGLRGNITTWKDAREEVRNFMEALRGLDDATTIQDMYEQAVTLRDSFRGQVDVTKELTSAQRSFWKELTLVIAQLERFGAVNEALNEAGSTKRSAAEEFDALQRAHEAQAKYSRSREASLEKHHAATIRALDEQEAREKARAEAVALLAQQERALMESMHEAVRKKALEAHQDEQAAIKETERYIKEMAEVFRAALQKVRDQDIAATARSLDALFRSRTLSYSIRFAGDEEVMGQSLTPAGGNPWQDKSVKDLAAMGVSTEHMRDVLGRDVSSLTDTGGGGGGGGADTMKSELDKLKQSFLTKQELLVENFEAEKVLLQEARDAQLIQQEEFQNLSLQSAQKYQDAKKQLINEERASAMAAYGQIFGNLATIAEAGGKRMVGVVKAASIAQGLLNAYNAYTQVLADPSLIGRPGLRQVLAYSTLAAGLAQVASMRSVNYGSGGGTGGGGGGGGGGAGAAAASASSAGPLEVQINGMGADEMISGANLGNLLERLTEEAGDRGLRLTVAT